MNLALFLRHLQVFRVTAFFDQEVDDGLEDDFGAEPRERRESIFLHLQYRGKKSKLARNYYVSSQDLD